MSEKKCACTDREPCVKHSKELTEKTGVPMEADYLACLRAVHELGVGAEAFVMTAGGFAVDIGMELARKELLLKSTEEVAERNRADREKLVESHGELAVELGRALFKIRRLEEDKTVLAEKLRKLEVQAELLARHGQPGQ